MYTECTVLFSSAQAHFTEANNPHANLRGVVDKTMLASEPLRVTERNAKPTIANPKYKYKYWRQTGVQSKHYCAAWPRTKQLHVFTHGHLPERMLSIHTCLLLLRLAEFLPWCCAWTSRLLPVCVALSWPAKAIFLGLISRPEYRQVIM
jgi:hypothetical protein